MVARNLNPRQFINQMREDVTQSVRTADGLLQSAVQNGSQALSGAATEMSSSLSQAAQELRDELPEFAESAQEQFLEMQEALQGTSLASNINILNDIKQEIGSQVAAAGSAIEAEIQRVAGGIFGDLGSALGGMTSAFPSLNLGSQRSANLGAISGEIGATKNPLNGYTHFNYVLTLGCLSNEELNQPDRTYRSVGIENVILRTTGGAKGKTTTAFERNGKKIEFFMDDLSIHSLIIPNLQSRQTNATNIEFTIMEPYSMGLFLQALQIASLEAGHRNYIEAPYVLMIEFTGWDHLGNPVTVPNTRRIFPFSWSFGEFNVQASGSTYKVLGTPYNERAFRDSVQRLPVDMEITGGTLNELIQTGVGSLASVLNTHLLQNVENAGGSEPDDYIFIFPKDTTSLAQSYSNVDTDQGAVIRPIYAGPPNAPPSFRQRENIDIQEAVESLRTGQFISNQERAEEYVRNQRGYTIRRSAISETIKTFNRRDANVNDIGKAEIVIRDPLAGGTVPWGQQSFNYDPETGLLSRDGMTLDPTKRSIRFARGTPIQRILEEMVLISSYGANSDIESNPPDENGMIDWFRIDAQVFNLTNSEQEAQMGRPPRVYVYRVVPYKVHESVFGSPSRGHTSYEELKKTADRTYNYIYSGENIDVLDFQINFQNAFFANISPTAGRNLQLDGAEGTTVPSAETAADLELSTPANTTGSDMTQIGRTLGTDNITAGAISEDEKIEIARRFNQNLIESNVDLVDMEVKILGDPYYLMDSGMGNYRASGTERPNLTQNMTANYENGQVDVIFNFRTPIDYNENGFMDFASDFHNLPEFSGLYQVNEVTSTMSRGVFTQDLRILRRPRQTLPAFGPGGMFQTADRVERYFLELQERVSEEESTIEDGNIYIVENLYDRFREGAISRFRAENPQYEEIFIAGLEGIEERRRIELASRENTGGSGATASGAAGDGLRGGPAPDETVSSGASATGGYDEAGIV